MHYSPAKSIEITQFVKDFADATMIHVVETADLRNYALEKVAFFEHSELCYPGRDSDFLQFFVTADLREFHRVMNQKVFNATKQQGQSANLTQEPVLCVKDFSDDLVDIFHIPFAFHTCDLPDGRRAGCSGTPKRHYSSLTAQCLPAAPG